jgi:hypothetical protein
MKQIKLLLFIIACTNIFAACKKDKNTTEPTDQLPPATQTGANTFGCLVNGKVFTPSGFNGNGNANPKKTYDIGINGLPYLSIDSYIYVDNISKGNIFISFASLNSIGGYPYPNKFDFLIGWSSILGNCTTVAFDTTIKKSGVGIITRLDIPNRIISGTFDCKFKTLQCDTVFITDGRFDIKF